MVVGPYQTFDRGDGKTVDLYLLRYAEDGHLLSTETERILKNSLDGVTEIYLFSHGWNNTFADASSNYVKFVRGYQGQREQFNLPTAADYQPLLIGIIWPSTSFVLPWEKGPVIAAESPSEASRTEEMLRLVTANVSQAAGGRLAELVDGSSGLDEDDARTAAKIVIDGLPFADAEGVSSPPTVDELLEAWAALDGDAPVPTDPNDFGEAGASLAAPRGAGYFNKFDPRNLLRMGTVWLMKDRAGIVGGHGVAPLVGHLLGNSQARLHLVGHSFGGRIVLSSVAMAPLPRPARSMLLLEPAVNRWCFAEKLPSGGSGGYQPVLDRVELPILSTFSRYDVPLTQAFQLAVRGSSLGEPNIAAIGDTDRYGALGGYGPAGLGDLSEVQPALKAGSARYTFAAGKEVIAVDGGVDLDGKPAIGSHSDVNNPTTWWALHCLTGPK
ncbi:MAG TPA: hypothetical protein VJ851_12855 [Jatrophihabitans sp.]|nr:hypothetical protein [Jatrophihabitans sp.]